MRPAGTWISAGGVRGLPGGEAGRLQLQGAGHLPELRGEADGGGGRPAGGRDPAGRSGSAVGDQLPVPVTDPLRPASGVDDPRCWGSCGGCCRDT
jgi:hypothetical protein